MAPVIKPAEGSGPLIQRLVTDNAVTIFSKSYCPFCNKIKDFFRGKEIKFESLELDLIGEQASYVKYFFFD